MSKKKIVMISVSVLLILAIITAVVLTTVYFCTQKDALDFVEIPVVTLADGYKSTISDTGEYLGHPDFVLADDGSLYCAYPAGHGKGDIIMQKS